jgi:amino acid transporter
MVATASATADSPTQQPELKRVMGPKLLLLFIVGDILGTGIYAVTGTVAQQVGGVVWLPFLLAFVVATITAAAPPGSRSSSPPCSRSPW